MRRDGVFTWLSAADARVRVVASDGTAVPGAYIAILDVPSLALATGAPNVHFAFAVGASTGRRRGSPASLEVRVDIEGSASGGVPLRTGRYLTHAAGQRPLTALGMALGVERLLALRGDPVPPGIHTPEALVDPAYEVERMLEAGPSSPKRPARPDNRRVSRAGLRPRAARGRPRAARGRQPSVAGAYVPKLQTLPSMSRAM